MSNTDLGLRSPFDNVLSFLGGLPHGHEKALKHALYNSLALFLLCIATAAGYALIIILEPFLRPLLWALMCGSVLHPFKHSLAAKFHQWITALESSGSPLVLCVVMVPITFMNNISEVIGSHLLKYSKPLIGGILGLCCLHLVYTYTPHLCICIGWKTGMLVSTVLAWFINHCTTWVVSTVVLGYLVLLTVFWQPDRSQNFQYASWPIWMLLSCYFANLMGAFQVAVFFSIQVLFVVGFLLEVQQIINHSAAEGVSLSFFEALKITLSSERLACQTRPDEVDAIEEEKNDNSSKGDNVEDITVSSTERAGSSKPATLEDDIKPLKQDTEMISPRPDNLRVQGLKSRIIHPVKRSHSEATFDGQLMSLIRGRKLSLQPNKASEELRGSETDLSNPHNSDKYFYSVMWACLVMLVFNHLWVLYFAPIIIFIYIIKHTGHYFGVWHQVDTQGRKLFIYFAEWSKPRRKALFPIPIHGLSKVFTEARFKFLNILKNSAEAAASVVVIFGVIIFIVGTTIFVAVQVYAEGMHVLQVGANVVNSTLVAHHEFFSEIIPDDWYNTMDSVVGNAYHQGREGISTMVRSWLVDVDKVKAANLEKQVLDLWDRIYQSWMMAGTEAQFVGPVVPPRAIWENVVDGFKMSPELFHFTGLVDFARANMDGLMSVLQTVWTISKGNISLALHSFTALISIVFGGGTAVLNLLLNIVVFFTALFYLLSSSSVLYRPVEMITEFSPTYGNRFAVALESAFTGVFKASFKISIFYGLWTWLIHNIFRVKIVYLPSVLAAMFAAIPFLGTYWACIPAVLDLWLAQNSGMQAILLFVFQFLPTSMVDTAIYKEIDGGGHPYLTGLSIAGGIFCFGAEGAIIGPLVLCGLFVVVNLSSSLMMDSPTTENRMSQRLHELGELSKMRMRRTQIENKPSHF